MDVFVEQIIKRKIGVKDILFDVGLLLLGIILTIASLIFLRALSFLVLIAVCYGIYYFATSRNLEFEYSITNGDITIDKIVNRRSRKRVISIDAKEIEKMGKYNPEEHRSKRYASTLVSSETDDGKDAWYFTGNHPKMGSVLVVFSPDEKVLTAIKPFLPRQVAIDAFGRN
ncbi:MAG TPA: DUF6106 family protein [Caproiciproducens sp.]|nr:DUF6106 family protein [Caproiciproducens sp.]